jgi:hypothetical protein
MKHDIGSSNTSLNPNITLHIFIYPSGPYSTIHISSYASFCDHE